MSAHVFQFTDLPIELQEHVLHFVPCESVGTASCVSASWRKFFAKLQQLLIQLAPVHIRSQILNNRRAVGTLFELFEQLLAQGVLLREGVQDYKNRDIWLTELKDFLSNFDFSGLAIDQALRAFISVVRLPGESGHIDRIMQRIADYYCECNPSANHDTSYTMLFATLMLNTDQHSTHIPPERRMDVDKFVRCCTGVGQEDLVCITTYMMTYMLT
eukprot:TRINITY_DN2404_c0_g1_i4.p1 TRINITY_DN2404_c0_g1~~TRINITY_DN2404_c0_g1_i4.p1  ORF type:complete len:215 (-),score=22.66 TRINITY_DN2404_c0_g1_i4:422-1066(-)